MYINPSLNHRSGYNTHYITGCTQQAVTIIAQKVSQASAGCFLFPLRYIGAKTWSIPGVIFRLPVTVFNKIFWKSQGRNLKQELFSSPHSPQLLSKEEAKKHLKRSCMTAFAHGSNAANWIEPFGYKIIMPSRLGVLDSRIESRKNCFFDPQSGLKIVLAEKGNEVMISFGAINSGVSELPNQGEMQKNWMLVKLHLQIILGLLGSDMGLVMQADEFFQKLIKSPCLKGKQLVLSGQCLGGSLAQFLSLKYSIPGYCYNCLPLGPGLQWQLGSKKLVNAPKMVTHVYAQGDFLNDSKILNVIDKILSCIGLKTPGNFGTYYYIPSAFLKSSYTHRFFIGSLLKYLECNMNAKAKDLPSHLLQI